MPSPAWTAPPATNRNASGIGAEALPEVGAVQITPRCHLVAFTPNQSQRLQPVDRELVVQRAAVDDLTQRRNQVLLALQPEQVVAEMIAERPGVVLGLSEQFVDA